MADTVDGWGTADLHVHTSHSDGDDTPAEVLEWADHLGIDVLAITDHDTIDGAELAAELAERSGTGPDVIVGEEVSSRDGHILGLFLSTAVPPGLSAEDTVAAIHEQGGIAIAAHPYWRTTGAGGRAPHGVGDLIEVVDFDAVEVLNGGFTPSMIAANQRASAAASGTRIGASDAHVKHALGWAHTRFGGRTAAELRASLCTGQAEPGRSRIDPIGVRRYATWSLGRLRAHRVAG
jgi:hypothetical protein